MADDLVEQTLRHEAEQLLSLFRGAGLMIATAESCTGGLISAALTAIPGSSDAVERGFVTYSNAAKTEMLGVSADLIESHGAVSEAVARAMAEGALQYSHADVAVSVTGVAGPGGGTPQKPVGRVHLGAARRGHETLHVLLDLGDASRDRVRAESVQQAFKMAAQLAAP